MRIIAGTLRSRRLQSPSGLATRPTLDQTRESLFNILQNRVAGARVLDLFAGSGALGLEALSRGADSAVFCDSSREAVRCVRQNIEALGLDQQARLLQMDWSRALETLSAEGEQFDLIFLDPPYDLGLDGVLSAIAQQGLLAQEGLITAEHDRRQAISLPAGLERYRQKDYRGTQIDFIRWEAS